MWTEIRLVRQVIPVLGSAVCSAIHMLFQVRLKMPSGLGEIEISQFASDVWLCTAYGCQLSRH